MGTPLNEIEKILVPEPMTREWLDAYKAECQALERDRIIALLESGETLHAEHECMGIYGEELRQKLQP